MFKIDINKKIDSDLPVIFENFKILHFDEEPILYTGLNKYGNRIIGSYIDVDEENKFERFLHSIISSKDYWDFINQQTSYLDLLKRTKDIFFIDKSFDSKFLNNYKISLENLPIEYKPLENSFCPKYKYTPTLNYTLSLKGKKANQHLAEPKELSEIQNSYTDLLNIPLNQHFIKNKVNSHVYISGYSASSFKINFEVKINEGVSNMFLSTENISQFLNNYISYCIKDLSLEINDNFKLDKESSPLLFELYNEFKEVYSQLPAKEILDYESTFLKMIVKSSYELETIANSIGKNFSNIELFNKSEDEEVMIGLMDSKYSENLDKSIRVIERITTDVEVDTNPKEYSILIYNLNTDTRNGNAYVKSIEDDTRMNKPKIKILGEIPLEETIYSESLYKNKWITVFGKATIIDKKYRKIEIIFD